MATSLSKYDLSSQQAGGSANLRERMGPFRPATSRPATSTGSILGLTNEFIGPQAPPEYKAPQPTAPLNNTGGGIPNNNFNDLQDLLRQNTDQQVSEIDSVYGDLSSFFDQSQQNLQGQQQSALEAARMQAEAQQSQLQSGRDSSLNRLGEQQTSVEGKTQDALAAARRLYNEQLMGFNQRFGAASSAGEASRALLGRESQRQFGDIRQQQAETFNQLNNQRNEVEQQFQAGLMQLQAAKQTAENEIRSRFQQALDQINSNRASSMADKANARLEALQSLRNDMFNLKVEEMNVSQQLQAQAQQSLSSVNQALQQFGGAVTGGQQAVEGFDSRYANTLEMGQRQTTSAPLTGPLASYREEEMFNPNAMQGLTFSPTVQR